MRRVVVGADDQGRSHVLSDEMLPDPELGFAIWTAESGQLPPAAHGIPAPLPPVQPPPGGSRWVLVKIPPYREMLKLLESPAPGVDTRGFHTTQTVDYDYILEGDLHLDLDLGSVELHPGDCVVLQAARHSWRNMGEESARFLAVLTTYPSP